MTVERLAQREYLQGVAADNKTTDAECVAAQLGSKFYETDTGKEYVKTAAGWVETYENAIGKQADAAYAGGATATIIAGLKGIYTKLGAVVLAAGSAVIGTVNKSSDYPVGATPWSSTDDGAAGAAKTLTKAAGGAGKIHYITAIEVVVSAAATAADVTVALQEDAAGTPASYWKTIIGNAAPRGTRTGVVFSKPIKMTANKTADLVVSAPGGACVASLSMSGYTL